MDPRQAPDVNLFCFIYLFYFINHVLIRVVIMVEQTGGEGQVGEGRILNTAIHTDYIILLD